MPRTVLARIRDGTLDSTRLASYRARLPDLDVAGRPGPGCGRSAARLVTPGERRVAELPSTTGVRAARWPSGSPAAGDLAALARRAVAVVGARACTDYGEHVAAELAAGLGDRGWTVVSGAAFGIDAAAHRGSLAVAGGHRRRAGLRGRRRLPQLAPPAARRHPRSRRGGLRAAARCAAHQDPVPRAQPRHRGARPGHRRRRGGASQRGVQHRRPHRRAVAHADGRPGTGHLGDVGRLPHPDPGDERRRW